MLPSLDREQRRGVLRLGDEPAILADEATVLALKREPRAGLAGVGRGELLGATRRIAVVPGIANIYARDAVTIYTPRGRIPYTFPFQSPPPTRNAGRRRMT